MRLPIDKYQCVICLNINTPMACEACWGAIHIDCSTTVWVIRNGEEHAHTLCKNCANEDDEDEQ